MISINLQLFTGISGTSGLTQTSQIYKKSSKYSTRIKREF